MAKKPNPFAKSDKVNADAKAPPGKGAKAPAPAKGKGNPFGKGAK